MNMTGSQKALILLLILTAGIPGFQGKQIDNDLTRAESTIHRILKLFDAGYDNLFYETYPYKPGNKVTYLAGDDTITGQRVAYLWPTSGVFSAVNALYKATNDSRYLYLLEKKILPGLEQYYDSVRKPACYQSYITLTGKSDRYYDDNVWLALDFCDLYMLTGRPEFLDKSVALWNFVLSGWDDKLGGGIYWCEQKKQSKNTCSNAPASVLALKLFEATRDSSYFMWGVRIYDWTRINLQDPADHLYFDNKSLTGKTDTRKYTYNSGQMLEAASMLYKLTTDKKYLEEAQHIAESVIVYFTEDYTTAEGDKIRLFKNTGTWFNSILFRGYAELIKLEKNDQYINIFRDNTDHLWNHVRDREGLFSKDWKGRKEDDFKSLLDQSGLVEIWAVLAGTD
jgi:predicted alpha-1,6-mannanase (GH76 family)